MSGYGLSWKRHYKSNCLNLRKRSGVFGIAFCSGIRVMLINRIQTLEDLAMIEDTTLIVTSLTVGTVIVNAIGVAITAILNIKKFG
jgi:hypothetical protein